MYQHWLVCLVTSQKASEPSTAHCSLLKGSVHYRSASVVYKIPDAFMSQKTVPDKKWHHWLCYFLSKHCAHEGMLGDMECLACHMWLGLKHNQILFGITSS